MRSTLTLLGLIAASCLLCDTTHLFTRLMNKLDPVSEMSDVLSNSYRRQTLLDLVKHARDHDWQPEFKRVKSANLQRAVSLFVQLKPDNICDPINSINARQLVNLAGERNREWFLPEVSERRVFGRIKELKRDVKLNCFGRYEDQWKADPDRDQRFENLFSELVPLNNLLESKVVWTILNIEALEAKQLDGACELSKNPKLKGDELKPVLIEIHKHSKGLEGPIKTDPPAGLTAEKIFEDYLVSPCRELLKQPEVETIFKPIRDLAMFTNPNGLVKSPVHLVRLPNWGSLYWAARYVFCDTLVNEMDIKKLERKAI